MRAIAVTGWLVIVGALLLWQGIGLIRGPEWPTMSDFVCARILEKWVGNLVGVGARHLPAPIHTVVQRTPPGEEMATGAI